MQIIGHIDRADDQVVEGWIHAPDAPGQRFSLQVFAGPRLLGEAPADRFRQDLRDAGMGDGHCAFSFALPEAVAASDLRELRLRLIGSEVYMLPEKDTIRGNLPARDPVVAATPAAASFGGLWIDQSDWMEVLAAKHRRGELSGELSTSIFRFVRDGYLVIRNAVPSAMVNALNEEIDQLWQKPPEGLLIETQEAGETPRRVAPNPAHREGHTRLLDIHAFSAAARRVVAAPAITAFLAAIFDDTPKAFQSFTLWNGMQQAMEKDSAVVAIDSDPRAMASAWIALEDVKPGTGELEYYIGSHRSAPYLFGGTTTRMAGREVERDRFVQSLHDEAARLGQTKGSFLAKKGDVLLWHADLAHADAAITKTGVSRQSMLTHFTPARESPVAGEARAELDAGTCIFVSPYADIV